jgi:hypothetical protein
MIPASRRKPNSQPWCVVRHLPNLQRLVVARFHRESDADGYLQVLRRLLPAVTHIVVYDATNELADLVEERGDRAS